MRRRYDRELEKLNDDLSDMGSLISDRITMAIYSMINGDKDTSLVIRQSDDEVDDYESKIESRALKLILKEQPVASDLRLISAALKMITDMERIGDHAVDIAEISLEMTEHRSQKSFERMIKMAELSIDMVKHSIRSYISGDLSLVDGISEHHQKVKEYFVEIRDLVIEDLKNNEKPEYAINLLLVAKYLERIGSHAKNISEWVTYSIEGELI
ncbi:MAG: phosphate signaling complex protein PhoU [Gallicola sp.]|uniref:phosphate signaling complex protein PhoU n=1 Tax=Gallicola sp. Sow4_E12 TaxID=3438785 RepID=UPI00181E86A0|nr:phosphate signaling complex protein PhoU [Gallicola sp.]